MVVHPDQMKVVCKMKVENWTLNKNREVGDRHPERLLDRRLGERHAVPLRDVLLAVRHLDWRLADDGLTRRRSSSSPPPAIIPFLSYPLLCVSTLGAWIVVYGLPDPGLPTTSPP